MSDLKKCPFCGGEAEYNNNFDGFEWIQCQECGARSSIERISSDADPKDSWNRRAGEPRKAVL